MAEMTKAEIRAAKRLAEKLKGEPEISNPHALARWIVKRRRMKDAGKRA